MKKLLLFFLLFVFLSSCKKDGTCDRLSFKDDTVDMNTGETYELVLSQEIDFKYVNFISSKPETAVVNSNGVVTALHPGTVTISAKYKSDIATCRIVVTSNHELILNRNKLDMRENEHFRLKVISKVFKFPEKSEESFITWSSSNNAVASVDNYGLVHAHSIGETNIKATDGTKECECKITVDSVNIGDYIYDDGSFSVNPDTLGRKIVGVVFYTGSITEHDKALGRDYPLIKTGLAVSTDGDFISTWQSSYSEYNALISDWIEKNITDYAPILTGMADKDEPLNHILGYNNTKALEKFNEAQENSMWKVDIIEKLKEYRNSRQVPAQATPWYIPSAKELTLLCSGEYNDNIWYMEDGNISVVNMINSKLAQIPDALPIRPIEYWSSTESDTHDAYSISMDYGSVGYFIKHLPFGVRFILAF